MKRCARALAIITLILGLCCSATAESVSDDPVVVRVGDYTYTRSQLQGSLDSALELSEMLRGDVPTEAEKAARLETTVESFVGVGVIENKLAEAGKNDFSEAELEELSQAASARYDEFWQLLYPLTSKERPKPLARRSDPAHYAHAKGGFVRGNPPLFRLFTMDGLFLNYIPCNHGDI